MRPLSKKLYRPLSNFCKVNRPISDVITRTCYLSMSLKLLLKRGNYQISPYPPPQKKMLPVSVWKYKTYSEVVPEKLNFVLK